VKRTIRGMLPNNKTRIKLLERVTVHRGQYHPHESQNLPQFINQPLPDPNEMMGLNDVLNPDIATVVADFSMPGENTDFASHLPREIDERIQNMNEYRPVVPRKKIAKAKSRTMKMYRRYKEYK
jgi:hypothetical protein